MIHPLCLVLTIALAGCTAAPIAKPLPAMEMPPPPVLSIEAKTDAKKAYVELASSYKELRAYTKQLQRDVDSKPAELACHVKFGDLTLPILGLGDIHFVIFSYCGLKP